jgi:hypothetical protein
LHLLYLEVLSFHLEQYRNKLTLIKKMPWFIFG